MEIFVPDDPIYAAHRTLPAGSTRAIHILIADDHRPFRAELRRVCEGEPDMLVVGEVENGRQAVEAAVALQPDIILMDIHMPEMDGIEAARRMRELDLPGQVIVLTVYRDPEHVLQALQAGAVAHLCKDAAEEALIHAIRAVHQGEALIDSQVTALVLKALRQQSVDDAHPDLTGL